MSPLGVSAVAPSPGEEEGGTPTSLPDLEERIATQVGPGVAAVPVGEETTEVAAFTTEPENRTEWEFVYTPVGTSPLPGLCGSGSGACLSAEGVLWGPGGGVFSPWHLCSGCPALITVDMLLWATPATWATPARPTPKGEKRQLRVVKHILSLPLSLTLSPSLPLSPPPPHPTHSFPSIHPRCPALYPSDDFHICCAPFFTPLIPNLLKTLLEKAPLRERSREEMTWGRGCC